MGRIVNFAEFVRSIRLQKGVKAGHDTILLELQDDILQENAGLWRWTLTQDASAAEKFRHGRWEKRRKGGTGYETYGFGTDGLAFGVWPCRGQQKSGPMWCARLPACF